MEKAARAQMKKEIKAYIEDNLKDLNKDPINVSASLIFDIARECIDFLKDVDVTMTKNEIPVPASGLKLLTSVLAATTTMGTAKGEDEEWVLKGLELLTRLITRVNWDAEIEDVFDAMAGATTKGSKEVQ